MMSPIRFELLRFAPHDPSNRQDSMSRPVPERFVNIFALYNIFNMLRMLPNKNKTDTNNFIGSDIRTSWITQG